MSKKNKWLALAMSAVLAIGVLPLANGCTWEPPVDPSQKDDPVAPPAVEHRVYSVTLQYNGKNIDGSVLSVDCSAGTIQLTANVLKDDEADGAVTYTSGDESIATVDKTTGLVTLKTAGETVITATAGGKTHSIVLAVGADDTNKKTHTVTVNGGTASVTGAKTGEYVYLDVNIPEHKEFVRWNFPNTVEWINGNMFKMPEADVEISAEFTDMLYTLNLIGATVVKANATENPEYTDGGYNSTTEKTDEYAINVYKLPYDAVLQVEAVDTPEGKIFIGWDHGTINNRIGETGNPEYSFSMPDSTLTVWGIFSTFNNKVYTAAPNRVSGYTASAIEDGAPSGSVQDVDLEGMNGYRLTLEKNKKGVSGYSQENVMGSQLDTTKTGTQIVKTIVKNHHDTQSVTLETYITYYGNIATSGEITVGPGETKTVYWEAGLGINNPWMGLQVRNTMSASSDVVVDVVSGMAPMYPNGDKQLSTSGKAEYVKLGGYAPVKSWPSGKPMIINNDIGSSYIAVYANNGSGGVYANGCISSIISNMAKYDENNTTTTIYGKIINMVNNTENPVNHMRIVVSKTKDLSSVVASADVVVEKTGDIALFKLEIPRTADDNGEYYIGIIKTQIESGVSLYAYNFCLQLTYNNVLGYYED